MIHSFGFYELKESKLNWLNYHHLYYFYTIASEGSIAKATKKLRLAQSTLSAQLSIFEDTCGCKLFERRNRALHLTENGQIIFDYADEIFSIGREVQDFLRDQKGRKKIKAQIGLAGSLPKLISEKIVDIAVQKHNGSISVLEGQLTNLLSKLKRHRLDFVLTTKQANEAHSQKLDYTLLLEIPIYIVGSEKWKNLKKNYPVSLNKKPFIYPASSSNLRNELNIFFDSKGIKPKKILEVQDIELQKSSTLNSHGISGLPMMSISREIESGALHLINKTPIGFEKLWLVTTSRKVQNPLAKAIIDELLRWENKIIPE